MHKISTWFNGYRIMFASIAFLAICLGGTLCFYKDFYWGIPLSLIGILLAIVLLSSFKSSIVKEG